MIEAEVLFVLRVKFKIFMAESEVQCNNEESIDNDANES